MTGPTILYVGFLVVVGYFAFVVAPKLDRDRIRENIEDHGGEVIEIVRAWEWGRHYDRCYDVSYMTAHGKRVNATCRTNMWRGVYWINQHPPGLFSEESQPDGLLTNDDSGEPFGTAEPIRCLGCGATIPATKARCSQCGWSYKEA